MSEWILQQLQHEVDRRRERSTNLFDPLFNDTEIQVKDSEEFWAGTRGAQRLLCLDIDDRDLPESPTA